MPIRRVLSFPTPDFKTLEEAQNWARRLTETLHEDATLRSYDIDTAITTTSHNHAASDINSGTLVHERGGLEADVSGYAGLVKISSGATSQVTDGSTNWNTAYTHSQIAGGDSVHVSTAENTAWDAAYTHSQIAGGNSVHVSTTENTNWDTAYTHSQAAHTYSTTAKARAYLSADQDDLTNNTWTQVNLNAESYDPGGNYDHDGGGYDFVVPVTGYYHISWSVFMHELTANTMYDSAIYVNGTETSRIQAVAPTTDGMSIGGSDVLYLTASQSVELWARSRSGGNAVDITSGAEDTFMAIHLISI